MQKNPDINRFTKNKAKNTLWSIIGCSEKTLYNIIMVIDINIYCLICLKLIKVFKDVIFEKNKMKSIKKNPDSQSSNVQYITEILMKIRKWSRENDGEFVVISSIVYVIVKPYHFFMSCLRMFQGPSCFQYKSDLAMHKSSLCILSARCLKHVSNLDFPSNSCYLFVCSRKTAGY